MKNKWIMVVAIILIIGFGIFLISGSKITNSTGNVDSGSNSDSGNIQKITIGIANHNYSPQTIKVKVNEPVRIYLDDSVTGCYRAFTIRDLGVSKFIQSGDYVEFTPNKKGTFQFACSMGMGTGTLIVE
jgi:plastocyanin domain-containing protein